MTSIYSVNNSETNIRLDAVLENSKVLDQGYSSLVTVQVENNTVLYAFNKTTKLTDVYTVDVVAPYLTKKISDSSSLNLYEWDSLKSFVLGNKPYLMAYEKKGGWFAFYEVKADLTLSEPYKFMNQRSWPTQDFSEVSPFVSVGLQYVLCYDDVKGTVAIFSLDVIATSAGGIPPLNMLNVWYHQWAKSWECFSFFQLGQSNFFFKINKGKLNVNIDHILDSPALGSVEIGSYLQAQLPNALNVTLAAIIPWANGTPYLATYDDTAKNLNIYNIHSDCQGWTNLNTTTVAETSSLITYKIKDNSYILLYNY
jgi:hypothetical protein